MLRMKIVSVLLGLIGGALLLIGVYNLIDGDVPAGVTGYDGFQAWSYSSLMTGFALVIGGSILVLASTVLAVAAASRSRVNAPVQPYAVVPPQG
jgi:hypothetical protein